MKKTDNQQFVLVWKTRKENFNNKFHVRVRPEAYAQLEDWAADTGMSLTELATRAIMYAADHAVYIDDDVEICE